MDSVAKGGTRGLGAAIRKHSLTQWELREEGHRERHSEPGASCNKLEHGSLSLPRGLHGLAAAARTLSLEVGPAGTSQGVRADKGVGRAACRPPAAAKPMLWRRKGWGLGGGWDRGHGMTKI
jgi:hypothetical protein